MAAYNNDIFVAVNNFFLKTHNLTEYLIALLRLLQEVDIIRLGLEISIMGLRLLLTKFALLLALSLPAMAVVELYEFDSEVDRIRYQSFIDELRCPKCQNQNLAGSDSPIASDLRRELYRLLEEGKSDQEIVDFMVARYGDYVLYRPQVKSTTYLLWGMPMVLVGFGILVIALVMRGRRKSASSAEALTAEQQQKLDQLLHKDSQGS